MTFAAADIPDLLSDFGVSVQISGYPATTGVLDDLVEVEEDEGIRYEQRVRTVIVDTADLGTGKPLATLAVGGSLIVDGTTYKVRAKRGISPDSGTTRVWLAV